ncbi:NAD-dependent epimerase/dehydratase family protein [Nitrogeniibacter aestuarii]|uniref:NAD-dependent epimerase/dehydratase family protein n=1 Tax=Nitrogeniibacter aestuarii TaxID=2815343 RepID=UPI001D110D0F|nr:NAD-dependent epimerase/dehydratase family protein [Nitrogeniibacter aestuarii]
MKILVTGASGFIGRHLVEHLDRAGHEVAGLVRAASRIPTAIAHVPMHIVDAAPDALNGIMQRERPDCVVHLAARYVASHTPPEIDNLIRDNVGFTAHLLDAMARADCNALVYAASAWQYGEAPVNLYAAAKNAALALADYYRSAHALRTIELAIYDSYGPGDSRPKLLNLLKKAADSADVLDMSPGEQHLHLVHVDDLADAFTLACERATGLAPGERRCYRLPSPEAIDLRTLVERFNAAAPDQPVRVRWGARPYRPREVIDPWADAPVLPDWQPGVLLDDGLRQFRAHPDSEEV